MSQSEEAIPLERIERNLRAIQARIKEATGRAQRNPDDIRLVAVTKYVTQREVDALIKLGVADFGESRIQEAEPKIKISGAGLRWHLIGHLQTNKADKAVQLFDCVHSVDSDRVATALNKEAAKRRKPERLPLPCFLEVNVAGEANKYGLKPDANEIAGLLKHCSTLEAIRITGLMCMAPYNDNPEPTSRPIFRRLRQLRDELNGTRTYPHALTELSMGMTQDYTIAIEEGATIVRVGSALFE
jgi:PLP dependent protein